MTLKVSVKISTLLTGALSFHEINQLLTDFFEWKKLGPAGEHESYIFGKDGFYVPPASPPDTLRHAHMVPPEDDPLYPQWNIDFKRRPPSRKTSNKALVYACNINGFTKRETYLLIGILENPNAHEFIKKRTPIEIAVMNEYIRIAQAFNHDARQPANFIDVNYSRSN